MGSKHLFFQYQCPKWSSYPSPRPKSAIFMKNHYICHIFVFCSLKCCKFVEGPHIFDQNACDIMFIQNIYQSQEYFVIHLTNLTENYNICSIIIEKEGYFWILQFLTHTFPFQTRKITSTNFKGFKFCINDLQIYILK